MDDRQLTSFQSSVSLTCTITGQPSPEVKWEHKGNSISTTDAQSNGVITSTHTVSYANAASVLSDHVCHRVDVSTRKVTCTSVAYACRARYKGGAFAGRSAVVIVSLMVPDAVTDLTVDNVLARSVTIKWTRPHPGDMPITSYRVECNEDANPASSKTATASASATDRAISGLKPYTEYRFRIMAITSVGEGLWSAFITSKTGQAAPSEPQNLAINVDASHPRVTLSWKVPTTPNGVIDGYTVYYKYLLDGVLSKEIADEKTLTVSVNITGGMRYRFEVSATTIEEGPKAMIEQVMRDYAPEAAPGGFSFRHVNATTYNCSWIPPPREKSHGDITKYEVRYTSQPTNRRRRSSDPVLVSTTETHALLFNLQLCRVFKIAARAWTSAGAGPWSEELTSENAALPPANVRILRTAVDSVVLEWTEPPLLGGEIMGYKIRYTGEKSYNKSFRHVGEQDTTSRTPTRLLVTTLVPGTNYRFEVATKAGCSQLVYSVTKPTAETDVSNPLPPEGEDGPTIPSSGTAVTITLLPVQTTNGPISSYQVIVLRMENDVATLPDDYENKLYNVTKAEQLGLPFYITAEIPGKNVTAKSSFSVGDGTTRGSYLNARLREGKQYKVFYRAMTDWKGTIYPGKYKMVMQLTVKKAPLPDTETGGSDSLPITLGVVIAVIALITVVVVVLFLRRRKTRGNRKNCEGRTVPLHHLESKENGNSSLQLMGEEPMAAGPSTKKKEVSPLAAGKYKVPEDNATTGARDEASPIYSNAMDDKEHKPIPVVQFSEYMNKVKRADFARLKQEYQTFPKVKQFAWSVAEKPENKKYNRYGNIIAYDHSRVVLDGCGETDYINANYVHGWDGTPKVYIATQGPVPNSFLPFWFMVWNQRVSSIVMTTNLMENGKKKCHEYWPEDVAKYGDIEVSLRKSEVFADFTIRTFLLSKGSETRNVSQFHFTVWPDHGVPRLPSNIISLRRRVRARTPANTGPILVHCSAGVGRTGTFIVIDAMLEQAKKEKKVDIFNYLTVTRNDRIHMVQTEDQYVFIHKAVLEALTCGNTEHAAHDLRHVMRKLGTLNQSQGKTGYEMEFERLGFVCPYAAPDECESAGRQENLSKNRSQAFAPLDISRVILNRPADGTHNDYINASFADAFRERNAFLMTQAPLPNTIEDFWQMVLQFSIGCVVMLNNLVEKSESYPQYWPKEVSKTATYGKITVTLESQEARGDVILRKLKVTDSAQTGKKSVIVQHLQHTAWPNHSVPAKLLGVLKLVTDVQTALQQCGNIEFIVHCSDGVGRSGTFCAIYSILERIKLEQVFDVFQAIKDIRVRRPSAVETWAQYKFCYEATQAYLDSFSDYANFSDC